MFGASRSCAHPKMLFAALCAPKWTIWFWRISSWLRRINPWMDGPLYARRGSILTEATDTSDKELRNFGLVTGSLFAALFGLGLPYIKGYSFPVWPWALASALWLPALLQPHLLKYPFLVWRRFGLALGWINSKVLLG